MSNASFRGSHFGADGHGMLRVRMAELSVPGSSVNEKFDAFLLCPMPGFPGLKMGHCITEFAVPMTSDVLAQVLFEHEEDTP